MPIIKTIEEMIATLPKQEQVIVKRLRKLIDECLPLATGKPYYGLGVPFYSRHRMICFIWPASVKWGSKNEATEPGPTRVSLGFCQGYLMANDEGALLAEGRKQVYIMYFDSLQGVEENQVRALLYEASIIDDMLGEKKKIGSKKKK